MIIKNINENEFDNFVKLYSNSKYQDFIKSLYNNGETKPEWCFVVEENGKFIGRVIYFRFEGNNSEMNSIGLDLPWEGNYIEIGEKLINESIEKLNLNNAYKIEFRCGTEDKYHKEMIALFKKAGCKLIQDKYRFTLSDFDKTFEYNKQLVFKTVTEVGKERFIKAIESVTVKTLDREDSKDIEVLGSEESAKVYFNILKSIDYNPDNWLLAYNKNANFIGLVVAQNLSKEIGCINYVGVVPEYRGNNYSKDLLIKGTKLLRKIESVKEIVADIDTENFPLEKNLSSINYKKSKQMWVYHKYL